MPSSNTSRVRTTNRTTTHLTENTLFYQSPTPMLWHTVVQVDKTYTSG